MSREGFKLSGEAFPLRCLLFFIIYWSASSWTFIDYCILQLQLKFGCNSSEDHQFVRGIPIYSISQILDKIVSRASGPPRLVYGVKRPMPLVRILEVELYPTLLSKARSFGLSDDWVQVLPTVVQETFPSVLLEKLKVILYNCL